MVYNSRDICVSMFQVGRLGHLNSVSKSGCIMAQGDVQPPYTYVDVGVDFEYSFGFMGLLFVVHPLVQHIHLEHICISVI